MEAAAAKQASIRAMQRGKGIFEGIMTFQNKKLFKKREKIYNRKACGGDTNMIIKTGCGGTACWYHCPVLCEEWEMNNKKKWGMHDRSKYMR